MTWTYLFKHWFGTLLHGPIIAQIIESTSYVDSHLIFGFIEIYPVFLLVGLYCSTPTYILYGFSYRLLARKNVSPKYAKPILISLSVSGVIITFWLIGGTMSYNGALSYSIASIITGLFFKLNFKQQ